MFSFSILSVIAKSNNDLTMRIFKYLHYFRCDRFGVSQETADFSNCVTGDTVTDFGVGYDFKSVMHYGLKRLVCIIDYT